MQLPSSAQNVPLISPLLVVHKLAVNTTFALSESSPIFCAMLGSIFRSPPPQKGKSLGSGKGKAFWKASSSSGKSGQRRYLGSPQENEIHPGD